MFAALFAAIAWNYVTWYLGLPSSSSHAIIGGLVGAGLAAGGVAAIYWDARREGRDRHRRVARCRVHARLRRDVPGRGRAAAVPAARRHPAVQGAAARLRRRPSRSGTAPTTRRRRWASSRRCCWRRAHPVSADGTTVEVPEWVALSAYSAIALGTLWGGWKIIETHGPEDHHAARQLRRRRQHRRDHRDLRRDRPRHPDLDHARRRLLDRGRGPRRPRRGATGSRRPDGARLGPHDPVCRGGRLGDVPPDPAAHRLAAWSRRWRAARVRRLGRAGR